MTSGSPRPAIPSARRVPSSRYTDPRFFAAETERLWPSVWLCAAHVSELPDPGTFLSFDLARETFLLTRPPADSPSADQRDRQGQPPSPVRAFHNVCAHRMNRLCAAPTGRADRLRCSYHGWEYDLCGKLVRLPRADRFAEPPRGLAPVRCETRLGFVWIACSDAAGSIDDFLAPVAHLIAPYHPEEMAIRGAATVEIACNWKLSADVSNEAYHLRALHPVLLELVDDTRVALSLHGPHSRYVIPFGAAAPGSPHEGTIGPLLADYLRAHGVRPEALSSPAAVRPALAAAVRDRARSRGVSLADLPDDSLVDKVQVHLFPNVQLNFTATSLELYRHRPHPTDPEATLFDEIKLERVPPGERPRPPEHRRFRHGEEPLGPIMGQDVDLLPGLQRGLRSSAFPGILLGADEAAILHMHAGLSRLLFGSPDPTFDPFTSTAAPGPTAPVEPT